MMRLYFQNFLMNFLKISLLCFIVLFELRSTSECNENPYIRDAGPLVETNSGILIGKYDEVFDVKVALFFGIPFAEPPINERRFSRAVPSKHWEGILFANEKRPACMQYSSREFPWIPTSANKSEDCLYLNIWAPVKSSCTSFEKLPVMVWFHGGGFYSGSSSMDIYDGSVLASYGEVIVVSVNYRLGVFGFFNSGTKEAAGNLGLYDQVLALQWIRANIENFGGDSKKVILFGESAGAMSISLHVLSPLSQKLFQKAIMQSGTSYQPQLMDDINVSVFKSNSFAELVGCSHENASLMSNPSEVISCLRAKNPFELAQVENVFTEKFPFYFGPAYGVSCYGCNDFLPDSPIRILKNRKFSQIPILIGTNKNEGAMYYAYTMPEIFVANQKLFFTLPQAEEIIKQGFSTVPEIPSEAISRYYFQNISADYSEDIVDAISNSLGDYVFACPSMFYAEYMDKAYFYWMSHRSLKDTNDEWISATHFDEVPYVFGKPILDSQQYTPDDGRFSLDVIQKWVSFAKEGKPISTDSSVEWPKFSASEPVVYELNVRKEGPTPFPRKEACEFWRPFFELHPSSKVYRSSSVKM